MLIFEDKDRYSLRHKFSYIFEKQKLILKICSTIYKKKCAILDVSIHVLQQY